MKMWNLHSNGIQYIHGAGSYSASMAIANTADEEKSKHVIVRGGFKLPTCSIVSELSLRHWTHPKGTDEMLLLNAMRVEFRYAAAERYKKTYFCLTRSQKYILSVHVYFWEKYEIQTEIMDICWPYEFIIIRYAKAANSTKNCPKTVINFQDFSSDLWAVLSHLITLRSLSHFERFIKSWDFDKCFVPFKAVLLNETFNYFLKQ